MIRRTSGTWNGQIFKCFCFGHSTMFLFTLSNTTFDNVNSTGFLKTSVFFVMNMLYPQIYSLLIYNPLEVKLEQPFSDQNSAWQFFIVSVVSLQRDSTVFVFFFKHNFLNLTSFCSYLWNFFSNFSGIVKFIGKLDVFVA